MFTFQLADLHYLISELDFLLGQKPAVGQYVYITESGGGYSNWEYVKG